MLEIDPIGILPTPGDTLLFEDDHAVVWPGLADLPDLAGAVPRTGVILGGRRDPRNVAVGLVSGGSKRSAGATEQRTSSLSRSGGSARA